VRSLQNDYAAEPQAPSTCQGVIQLDVKATSRMGTCKVSLSVTCVMMAW
jgi:hypothetical protein